MIELRMNISALMYKRHREKQKLYIKFINKGETDIWKDIKKNLLSLWLTAEY